MKKLYILLFVGVTLLLSCMENRIAGTVSDTDTGKIAMLCNPDGSPAVGAEVKFFNPENTQFECKVTTDTNGRYPTKGLAKGIYNIWAENDTLVAFQYSVFISDDTNYIRQDTLQQPGSITGIIGVQPNTDPRTVTVQVLGTEIYSGVDENGRFVLKKIAKGEYTVRLITTEPEYSPTFYPIQGKKGENDTLTDTLWLTYTGIPVVLGLTASYDTANGLVTVRWKPTPYKNFQDYLIFRDAFDAIGYSVDPVAAKSDTFFVDPVFNPLLPFGTHSFSDTNDYHLKYRVAVRSNTTTIGSTYRYVDIMAASPVKVATKFAFSTFHIAKERRTDSASINDTLLFLVEARNPTRKLSKIVWTDYQAGKVIRTRTFDTASLTCEDTVRYEWGQLGLKGLECAAIDVAGTVWRDTVYVLIVKDSPHVKLTTTVSQVSINDSIWYTISSSDFFGKVVKYEIGQAGYSGSFKSISGNDSFCTAPGIADHGFRLAVRVTDDDGNISQDSVPVRVVQDPPVVVLDSDAVAAIGEEFVMPVTVRQQYGKIVSYKYDFEGDAIWDDSGTVLSSIKHIYTKGGTYRPTIKVMDDDNNETVAKTRILVATIVPTSTVAPSTWTPDKNPYYIGKFFSTQQAITIEPGVEIRIDNLENQPVVNMYFGGALRSVGTKAMPVVFTNKWDEPVTRNFDFENGITYGSTEPLLLDSNGRYISGSEMEYTIINYALFGIDKPDASLYMSNCVVNSKISIATSSNLYMSGCSVKNDFGNGIYVKGHLYIDSSSIVENRGAGITMAEAAWNCDVSVARIRNCTIARNGAEGIVTSLAGNVDLAYCTITDNKSDGIAAANICGISMSQCNIFKNSGYQIRRSQSGDIHVERNFWGTDDDSKMCDLIYDKNDNLSSGEVFFAPILTTPVLNAGPIQ